MAAVRRSVRASPSSTASGSPVWRSSTRTVACTVAAADGSTVTSLTTTTRALHAGISSSVSCADSRMRVAQRHFGAGDEGGFQRPGERRPGQGGVHFVG